MFFQTHTGYDKSVIWQYIDELSEKDDYIMLMISPLNMLTEQQTRTASRPELILSLIHIINSKEMRAKIARDEYRHDKSLLLVLRRCRRRGCTR